MTNGVALITGAASGIGAATAARLAGEGRTIIAVDVDAERLKSLAGRLPSGACHPTVADVRDAASLIEAVAAAVQATGRLAAICVNAGVGDIERPLLETSAETIDWLIDVNLKGAINSVRATLPHIEPRGAIVFTSSTSGLVAHPGGAVYGATKIALIGLMRSLASELAPQCIRVNAVCPGGVRTEMIDKIYGAGAEQAIAAYEGVVPLGRSAEPGDVANAIAFLASEQAAHITGVALRVDGGDGIAGVL